MNNKKIAAIVLIFVILFLVLVLGIGIFGACRVHNCLRFS